MGAVALFFAGCDSGGGNGGNDPPSASISVESMSGRTVNFSAANSSDPDGSIESYSWEFGDGEQGSGETVSHTYSTPGSFSVTLTVTDDADASDTTTTDINLTATTFEVKIENVSAPAPLLKSGAFTTPVDASEPGPAGPGDAYEFSFTAGPNEVPGTGMSLSFATMFVQSNDMFYAFNPPGLPLFDENGGPIGLNSTTDVTSDVYMWDAGTEEDQLPGNGDNQAPRQGDGTDIGPDDGNTLTRVTDTDDDGKLEDGGFEYPAVSDAIKVTVSSQEASSGGYQFTVRVENVGSSTQVNTKPLVLSPGSFAAHWDQTPAGDEVAYPQFVPGEHDDGQDSGIERIAEDGSPTTHAGVLSTLTGVTVPLSPGGVVAHTDQLQLFNTGESASDGVESIAEDGDPAPLAGTLNPSGDKRITDATVFSVPDGASEPGPIAPTPPDAPANQSYTVTVDAVPGDRLSLGTMYIQSNDVFYAFAPGGVPLYDGGSPINGDVTNELRLYDAGTEVDEEPGVGLNQAPRQESGNTGPSGEGSIAEITNTDNDSYLDDDGFNYVPILDGDGNPTIIKVTVTPQ